MDLAQNIVTKKANIFRFVCSTGDKLVATNMDETLVQCGNYKEGFYSPKESAVLQKLYIENEFKDSYKKDDKEPFESCVLYQKDVFFYKINDSIRNKIKIAELYTSKDPAREFMQGVFFDKEGKIVATDGRIMYVTNGIPEFPVCQIKVTKILLKILDIADYIEMGIKYANSKNKETNQEVRVAKYIIFNFKIGTSEFTYSCKLIEGKFPNWKAVIPEKQDFHVVPFDKKIWKDIYSASKKLQPKNDKNLCFTIEDSNHVTISNDDIVYATIEWSIEPDINKRNVLVFNADYLNILLTKSGELIDIGYTNFLRAFTFTYKDGSIAVAMPTQIKE
jgi:hypothetical protein